MPTHERAHERVSSDGGNCGNDSGSGVIASGDNVNGSSSRDFAYELARQIQPNAAISSHGLRSKLNVSRQRGMGRGFQCRRILTTQTETIRSPIKQ